MDIVAAIMREERKLEKQLGKLNHQLGVVRAAAKALGHSANKEITVAKKRVPSAAGRAAMVKAAKKRWRGLGSRPRGPSLRTLVSRQVPTSSLEILLSREVVVLRP